MPIRSRNVPLRPLSVALAAGLLSVASVAALAQDPVDAARASRAAERQDGPRALADSVRRVERATRGEVLSAERVPFDGRDVNRVKVVDASGRVRVYMDDPREGRGREAPRRTRGNDGNSD